MSMQNSSVPPQKNLALSQARGFVERPLLPYSPQFLDTGIVVSLDLPHAVNYRRPGENLGGGNLPPLFTVLVNDRYSLDVNDDDRTPINITSPNFASEHASMEVFGTLLESLNTYRARTFAGYRGGIKIMFQIVSGSITQGAVSFIKGKNMSYKQWDGYYPDFNADEPGSHVVINLAQDRMIVVDCAYDEMTEWVNSNDYYRDRGFNGVVPFNAAKNTYRNWIAVRADTNLSTITGQPSQIIFKIFVSYDSDFEFLYPTVPVNMSYPGYYSVISSKIPFSVYGQIVYQTTSGSNYHVLVTMKRTGRQVLINTSEDSTAITGVSSITQYFYDDGTKYWPVTTITITTAPTEPIKIFINGISTAIKTINPADLTFGMTWLTIYGNYGELTPPPHPPPVPSLRRTRKTLAAKLQESLTLYNSDHQSDFLGGHSRGSVLHLPETEGTDANQL